VAGDQQRSELVESVRATGLLIADGCRSRDAGLFWNATPNFRVLLCASSCAPWSPACARTALVRAPRLASARSPSSTASALLSIRTCTSTASSSTACSTLHHERGHGP